MEGFKFDIGVTAQDVVTGFEGVITGRAQHLTGCNTYGLLAKASEGKVSPAEWFDENRLLITNRVAVALPSPARVERARSNGPGGNPVATRTVGR